MNEIGGELLEVSNFVRKMSIFAEFIFEISFFTLRLFSDANHD